MTMLENMYNLTLTGVETKPEWAPDTIGLQKSTYVEGQRLAIIAFAEDDEYGFIENYSDLTVNLIGNPEVVDYPATDWSNTAWVRDSVKYLLDACIRDGIAEIVGTTRFGIGCELAYLVQFDVEKIPDIEG